MITCEFGLYPPDVICRACPCSMECVNDGVDAVWENWRQQTGPEDGE